MARKRILVVDDDPLATGPLRQILAEKGYEVAVVAGGDEALALLAREAFDLVLLDVLMPGLSGYDVCRRIREDPRTRQLPVVFLTGHAEGKEGAEAGSGLCLVKPVLASKLLRTVEAALAGDPRSRKPEA